MDSRAFSLIILMVEIGENRENNCEKREKRILSTRLSNILDTSLETLYLQIMFWCLVSYEEVLGYYNTHCIHSLVMANITWY